MSKGLEQPQHDTNALLTGNGGKEGAATLRTIEAKNNSLVLFSVILKGFCIEIQCTKRHSVIEQLLFKLPSSYPSSELLFVFIILSSHCSLARYFSDKEPFTGHGSGPTHSFTRMHTNTVITQVWPCRIKLSFSIICRHKHARAPVRASLAFRWGGEG